jgi:hypothetical protein
MPRYRVSGLPEGLAQTVRLTLRSPQYGHPAHVETASGYGPCRQCLQQFREGEEERILFTYQPFAPPALPSPGPVFIHRDACPRYDRLAFPEGLHSIPLVVESYDATGRMLQRNGVGDRAVESVLQREMADPRVEYLHLRNAEAGCFIARVQPVFVCD